MLMNQSDNLNSDKKLEELPVSSDGFWEKAETYHLKPKKVAVCATHGRRNWVEHKGYIDNHDSTVSCKYCGWGCALPGYMKLIGDRVVDLRSGTDK